MVVIHDETLERTTNGTGNVADFAIKELQAFDAGQGQAIPTLREVLEAIPTHITLFIEIKDPSPRSLTFLAEDLQWAKESLEWDSKNLVCISFYWEALRTLRAQNTEIALGVSYLAQMAEQDLSGIGKMDYKAVITMVQALNAAHIVPNIEDISQEIIEYWRMHSVAEIHCWTVREMQQKQKATLLALDGIMCDDVVKFL